MTDRIATDFRDGVTTIAIDRVSRKNALTSALYAELERAIDDAQRDPDVGALIITGAGGAFTSGNDLQDFLAPKPEGQELPAFRFMRTLTSCPKPIVAAVDGAAVGIGTTMLLHCDLVLATPDSYFKLPFVDLGLVPEFASSLLLPRLMGHQRATELLLLCDTFDADTAYLYGLVNRLVPGDVLLSEAQELARRMARKPREAVQRTKSLLRRGDLDEVMARISEERELIALALRSEVFRDAVPAFSQRRSAKPQ